MLIKTFLHDPDYANDATGTKIDEETVADTGDFQVTVQSTIANGCPIDIAAGSYQITCTATLDGYSESVHSNAVNFTVNAAPTGQADDFSLTSGRSEGGTIADATHPWVCPYTADGDVIPVIGTPAGTAVRSTATSKAVWNEALANNQYVQAQISAGLAGGSVQILARCGNNIYDSYLAYIDTDIIKVNRLRSPGYSETTVLQTYDGVGDGWIKLTVSGSGTSTVITLYTSTNGTSWTQRGSPYTDTSGSAIDSGYAGFAISGTGTRWIANWSAGAL